MPEDNDPGTPGQQHSKRPQASNVLRSMGRGTLCKCPKCGEGKLFTGFLALAERCAICEEPLSRYEPDLLLALLLGLVVVAIAAFVFYGVEIAGGGSPFIYLTVLVPLTAIVTLLIIRPFKGGLVGLMWTLKGDNGKS